LDHDHYPSVRDRDLPAVKVHQLWRLEAERTQLHTVFVDGGAIALDLLDERYERAPEGDDVREALPALIWNKSSVAVFTYLIVRPSPITSSGCGRASTSASQGIPFAPSLASGVLVDSANAYILAAKFWWRNDTCIKYMH
jgi:hypothetical protein